MKECKINIDNTEIGVNGLKGSPLFISVIACNQDNQKKESRKRNPQKKIKKGTLQCYARPVVIIKLV